MCAAVFWLKIERHSLVVGAESESVRHRSLTSFERLDGTPRGIRRASPCALFYPASIKRRHRHSPSLFAQKKRKKGELLLGDARCVVLVVSHEEDSGAPRLGRQR